MKKLLCILVVLLASVVWAAPTVTVSDRFVEITAIDADWDFKTTFPNQANNGISVDYIMFSSTNAADKISIKHASDSGASIFPAATVTAERLFIKVDYHNKVLKPYIDFSASTVAGTEQVIIVLGG